MRRLFITRKYFLFIVIVFVLQKGFSQEYVLAGFIKDSLTRQPVQGAFVLIPEQKSGTQSNDLGKFYLSGLKGSVCELTFSCLGYATKKIVVKADTNRTVLSIFLTKSPIALAEIKACYAKPDLDNTAIINGIDRQLRPTNSAQDLLRLVPGLFTAQHHGGGKSEQIFLRGFDSDHGTDFAIFLDGMPVNMVSHAHGQGYADFHFVIPETIDKLSVYKGPYSAKFGDFATSGAGEFKTKNSCDRNMVKLEAGRFNTYRVMTALNLLPRKKQRDSLLAQTAYIAGEYNYMDSYFEQKQHYYRYNIFGKYTARFRNRNFLNISASTFNSAWDASGQIAQRALSEGVITRYGSLDPTEGGNTNRTNVNMSLFHTINNTNSLKNQFYYSSYNFNLYSNFTFFLLDTIRGDQINQADKGRNMYGYSGSFENTAYISDSKLTSIFGITDRLDRSQVMLRHSAKREVLDTFAVGNLFQNNAAMYLDEKLQLSEKMSVNLGLRADHFLFCFKDVKADSLSGSKQAVKISPKLTISYNLNENAGLFARIGSGFHSNDARSVIVSQTNQQNLPAALGYEVGPTFKPCEKMVLNVVIWGMDMEGELVYEGDVGVVSAVGATRRYGVDAGIRWQLVKYFFVDADLNYSHARLRNAPVQEAYLPLSPVLTSVAGLSFKSAKGFEASLRYRYMSDRPANEDNSIRARGYFLLDAVGSYTTSRFQVGISVENVLNTTWNQAQFATLSRLKNEKEAVNELHFTPGTPFYLKSSFTFFF